MYSVNGIAIIADNAQYLQDKGSSRWLAYNKYIKIRCGKKSVY